MAKRKRAKRKLTRQVKARTKKAARRLTPKKQKGRITVDVHLDPKGRDELIAALKRTGKLSLGFEELDSLSLPEGFLEHLSIED